MAEGNKVLDFGSFKGRSGKKGGPKGPDAAKKKVYALLRAEGITEVEDIVDFIMPLAVQWSMFFDESFGMMMDAMMEDAQNQLVGYVEDAGLEGLLDPDFLEEPGKQIAEFLSSLEEYMESEGLLDEDDDGYDDEEYEEEDEEGIAPLGAILSFLAFAKERQAILDRFDGEKPELFEFILYMMTEHEPM